MAHGEVRLPTVSRREVHCRSPLVTTPQVVQVEIVGPGGGTVSFGSVNASFEYLPRPSFSSISRYVAPVGPDLSPVTLLAFGSQFDERYSYQCFFTLLSFKNQTYQTFAQRIDDQSLSCPLPTTTDLFLQRLLSGGPAFANVSVQAEWPTPGLGLAAASERVALSTAGRVLIYLRPSVASIWPDWGSTAGGSPVYVAGTGLNLGLAQQILCKFGDQIVTARVLTPSTLLRCMSPGNP